jgi:hypothetical protein
MKLENIFTGTELALIDSGNYKPGRAILEAKLDLIAAMQKEACAKVCDEASAKAMIEQSGPADDLVNIFLRHHAAAHQNDAAVIRAM